MRREDPGEEIAKWTYCGSGRNSGRAGTGTTQAIHVTGQILRRDVGHRVVIWWNSDINIVALVGLSGWSDRGIQCREEKNKTYTIDPDVLHGD